jgi:hypothetical protein
LSLENDHREEALPAEFRRDVVAVAQKGARHRRSVIPRCTCWSRAGAQRGVEPGVSLCTWRTWRIWAIVTTVLVLSDKACCH